MAVASFVSPRQVPRLLSIACGLLCAALLCLPFAVPSLAADSGGKDGTPDDNAANAYTGTDSSNNYASSSANVTIDTGGTGKDIYGGYAASGDATGNTVTMTGGVARRLYGGWVVTEGGKASGNTISISGGTIQQYVIGGWGGNATTSTSATGNTIRISGSPVLTNAVLYGGWHYSSSPIDEITGNTLEIRSVGLSAKNVANFENYHFILPGTVKAGDTVLTLTDPNGTDISNSKVGVAGAAGTSPLQKGDTVTLLKNENGLTTTGYTKKSLTGTQGISLEYDFTLNATLTTLDATVDTTPDPTLCA